MELKPYLYLNLRMSAVYSVICWHLMCLELLKYFDLSMQPLLCDKNQHNFVKFDCEFSFLTTRLKLELVIILLGWLLGRHIMSLCLVVRLCPGCHRRPETIRCTQCCRSDHGNRVPTCGAASWMLCCSTNLWTWLTFCRRRRNSFWLNYCARETVKTMHSSTL